jgi:hypothetical protein
MNQLGLPLRLKSRGLDADLPGKRFWSKVDKRSQDECWPWKASANSGGYGAIKVNGKAEKAHRVSWKIHNGSIPYHDSAHGMCVLHKCDNPGCVNPNHLFLGTNADNMKDMVLKGRSADKSGEKNENVKLTASQVREIRRRHKECGVFHRVLAAEYGVSRVQIGRIVCGESWRWVL